MSADQQRYKSELYIPIKKDDQNFEERERHLWGDVQQQMDRRRAQWDTEIERMRSDFFKLKPSESGRRGSGDNLLADMDTLFDGGGGGGSGGGGGADRRFRVSFDVKEFRPEEINVRTQERKLVVHAKHEEKGGGKSMSRQFSRQVDLPAHVDPNRLSCMLSKDGILTVEAPVAAPEYERLRSDAVPEQYLSGPVVTEQRGEGADNSRMMRMVLDIGMDYRPDELTVKTVDKKLVVHARHEEKTSGRTMFREFNKEYELPETVDPFSVNAFMSDDGKLTVEAPFKKQPVKKKAGGHGFRITVGRR